MRAFFGSLILGASVSLVVVGCPRSESGGTGAQAGNGGTGAQAGNGGTAGEAGCRDTCDLPGESQATCVFPDLCLGYTYCYNGQNRQTCTTDADCTLDPGTYCRPCSAGGAGVCTPQCDGGACDLPLYTPCTKDSDCPGYCIGGLCSETLGSCMSCI